MEECEEKWADGFLCLMSSSDDRTRTLREHPEAIGVSKLKAEFEVKVKLILGFWVFFWGFWVYRIPKDAAVHHTVLVGDAASDARAHQIRQPIRGRPIRATSCGEPEEGLAAGRQLRSQRSSEGCEGFVFQRNGGGRKEDVAFQCSYGEACSGFAVGCDGNCHQRPVLRRHPCLLRVNFCHHLGFLQLSSVLSTSIRSNFPMERLFLSTSLLLMLLMNSRFFSLQRGATISLERDRGH